MTDTMTNNESNDQEKDVVDLDNSYNNDPPLPGLLMGNSSGDPLHASLGKFKYDVAADADDFQSEHRRRERAFMWHRR